MIELADKWTRQPQRALGINRDSPLTVGLTRLTMPGIDFGRTRSGLFTPASLGAIPTAVGVAGNFNGSASLDVGPMDSGALTVMVGAIADSGSLKYLFGLEYNGVSEPLTLRINSGSLEFSVYEGGVVNDLVSVSAPSADTYNTFYGIAPPDGTTETHEVGFFSRQGAKTSATKSIQVSARNGVEAFVGAGKGFGSPWRQYAKPILWAATWKRQLTSAELAEVARNPWQLYAKRPKRIFVSAGGGATESVISAASGVATASTVSGSSVASTTIAGASGVSTASTIVGASTAVATVSAASGASTASTLTGLSVNIAAISAASGAATASTIAASSTAVATVSAASGAATASTLTGASTAVSTLSAAAGVSTASTLTGVAGSGSTIGVAAGVSTASTIAASSVAESTISAATGASSDQIIVGAAFAEAAISGASGVSTCSTLTGSNAAGLASIEVAAGVSSAQIIVGSSFAAAAIAAATGVATCSTMTGLGGADAEEAYPLKGSTPSYPLSGLESSALSDPQTYPLQGLTQE